MLLRWLIQIQLTLIMSFVGFAAAVGQDDVPPEPTAPTIANPAVTAPTAAPPELIIPEPETESQAIIGSAVQQPNQERRDLPGEGQLFIRSVALMLLPQKFEDTKDWGDEKRIQSGLNVDFENGRLKTSRRWNMVNHGSWLQGAGELVNPETTFLLKASQLPDPDASTQRYQVNVSTKLNVSGRQQQWNYGAMLWSVSAEATADISIDVTVDVKAEVVTTKKGSRLRFLPNVTQAAARLDNLKLHRISHVKGTAVKGIGELVEELIQLRIKRENKDLAARINKAIQKKPERLEIPFDIGGLFGISRTKSDAPAPSSPSAP